MKLINLKYPTTLLLFSLFLNTIGGCSASSVEEEVDKLEEEELNVSMTAEVNGVNFESSAISNEEGVSASIKEFPNGLYIGAIAGYDFHAGLTKPRIITMYIIWNDFDNLKEGKIFNNISSDLISEGAYAWYTQNNSDGNSEGFGGNNELKEVFVKITSVNKEKKHIAGEFSYKGTSSVTGKTYTITNGKFTDVPFKLEQN